MRIRNILIDESAKFGYISCFGPPVSATSYRHDSLRSAYSLVGQTARESMWNGESADRIYYNDSVARRQSEGGANPVHLRNVEERRFDSARWWECWKKCIILDTLQFVYCFRALDAVQTSLLCSKMYKCDISAKKSAKVWNFVHLHQ